MPTFQSLRALIPNAELLLIGDPEQPSIIQSKQYAADKGFAERVRAIPVIDPPEDFYATIAQCQVWVATLGDDTVQGRHELRMELLEVGLLGKPVVAVRTPGLIEHGLSDGRELIYIDPSDPVRSAAKLAELIQKPKLLANLGTRLRTCVVRSEAA